MTSDVEVSDKQLEAVLHTAVDGIVVIDSDARIIMFNRACEILFGYEASEVIGKNVKCIMPKSYSDNHDRYMSNYESTGTRRIIGIGREVAAQHKDGTVFPIDLSVGEAKTDQGVQYVGIIRDLTARREEQARMKDLQGQLVHMARISALDEMGATLAHELNQPLTAIMLYLQAVERGFMRDESAIKVDRVREILHKAVHEAERAGGIIHRLRQFVERRDTTRVFHDLRGLVNDAVELASIGARSKGIVVQTEHAIDSVDVMVDSIQVQQIIINLVRNAVDALDGTARGEIVVSTKHDDKHSYVQVDDNGPGVAPDFREELFQAFKTTKAHGLGIGLAIARTIAQNHDGELIVSDSPIGGARFILKLPYERDMAGSKVTVAAE